MGTVSQRHIFNTAPKHDVFGLYNTKRAINYKQVVRTFNFTKKEVSKATRTQVHSVSYENNKIPEEIKEFLSNMIWLLQTTYEHLQDKNKVIQWLDSPNPICGGYSPKEMIRLGQYKKLINIVSSYAEGEVP